MQFEPRTTVQPLEYRLVFVSRVVVEDQMYLKLLRRFSVNLFEESKSLHVGVPLFGTADQLLVQVIQRGE